MSDMMEEYDRWKLAHGNNEDEVSVECLHCKQDIYVGEECLQVEDGHLHEDCFRDFAWALLSPTTVRVY